ncbi:EthD domain-containing protein [Mycolicibacterium rutilum]|uniref:EthD domain-containing protein n=1 Tax=Mycolicibacterium rutilum TaxID=370526 RepID=A0A1H6JFK3_MYCRU|nr:ATP-binding protein [Mycolicibacterium rutilum]SEH57678.1 EthD domain-containing protein [Mycolicibacterium rutilum]
MLMGRETTLVERQEALDELGRIVSDAVDGRGAVANVLGPAGIGKTALLDTLASSCPEARVLRARCSLLERDYSFGTVRQLLAGAQAMRKLAVDDKHMTDLTRSPAWFADERVIVERGPGRTVALPGGPYLKFYSGWYARGDIGRDDAHAAYRDRHAELVASVAADLGLARYVQNTNIYEPTVGPLLKSERGTEPDGFDGLDEFVWLRDDLIRALATPQGRRAAEAVGESQDAFGDRATSPSWFVFERLLY